jgi:HD-GYP domain-containing protein (c-di-GMP phosphodiesterase class II)
LSTRWPCNAASILTVFSRFNAADPETSAHCLRVALTARRICGVMCLAPGEEAAVFWAGLFHDIGKTGVSARIIRKEGELSGKEFEAVKLHTERTREILGRMDWPAPLDGVPEIAGSHHERWDGSGYPRGLAGVQIPLGARVIAVADYFDALTSRRSYRAPLRPRAVRHLLAAKRGEHFAPAVIDAFLRGWSVVFRRWPSDFGPPRFLGGGGSYTLRYFRRTASFSRSACAVP